MKKKTFYELAEDLKQKAADLDERTNELVVTRTTEEKVIGDLLDVAKKRRREAEAIMKSSISNGDLEAYKTSTESFKGSCAEIEFQTERLKSLKRASLIDKETYDAERTVLYDAFSKLNAAAKNILYDLSKEMCDVGTMLAEAIEDANKALENWQKKAYTSQEDANKMPIRSDEIRDYETVFWGNAGINAPQFKAMSKERGELNGR